MTNETENWNDYDYVLQRVAQNGFALRYASKQLKNNKEIVKIAVAQWGLALEYASEELRNDPEIVKIAESWLDFTLCKRRTKK
jgi:hypothetical protein